MKIYTLLFLIMFIGESILAQNNNSVVNQFQDHLTDDDIPINLKLRLIDKASAIGKSYNWKKSSLKKQRINTPKIKNVYKEIEQLSYINSLVIVKNGFLVSEKYYNGGDKNTMDMTFSVTKSITSTLIGIAIEQGFIESVNDKMLNYFPEIDTSVIDPRKKEITIKQLLEMQAGFDKGNILQYLVRPAENVIKAILESELLFDPGTKFSYSTYGSHILSAIIKRSTGMNTYEFAKKNLFEPLGIKSIIWLTDKNNISIGGGGIMLTPRDMARFGYLYLNNGIVDNKNIISEYWIECATQNKRKNLTEWYNIKSLGYGYQWWTGELNDFNFYAAIGHGGQWIVVVLSLNLVIASTMDPRSEENFKQMNSIIPILSKIIDSNYVN